MGHKYLISVRQLFSGLHAAVSVICTCNYMHVFICTYKIQKLYQKYILLEKMESLNFLGGMKNPFVLRFWPR